MCVIRENTTTLIKIPWLRKIPWNISKYIKTTIKWNIVWCSKVQSDYIFEATDDKDLMKRLERIGCKTGWAKILG